MFAIEETFILSMWSLKCDYFRLFMYFKSRIVKEIDYIEL